MRPMSRLTREDSGASESGWLSRADVLLIESGEAGWHDLPRWPRQLLECELARGLDYGRLAFARWLVATGRLAG